MKTNKLLKGVLLIFSMGLLPAQAQVTIGSGEAPVEGAILQVKTKTGIIDDSDNATKGVAFPRVPLTAKKSLLPMVSGGGTLEQKATHTGLVVFNTNEAVATDDTTFKFEKGLYVWKGGEWTAVGSLPEVGNALRLHNDSIKWGGKLIENTTIDLNKKNLTITADNELFYIKGLTEGSSDSRALVVDMYSGEVGTAPSVPAILTFVQSTTPSSFYAGSNGPDKNKTLEVTSSIFETNLNTGKKIVVPFSATDIVKNNKLTTFDASNNAFTLLQNGDVEISGYTNYECGNAEGIEVLLNLTMQIRKNVGTPENPAYLTDGDGDGRADGGWVDYSSVRAIWVEAQPWYRNTLVVPPAIYEGSTGDQIRMIIVRPYDITGSTAKFLGAPHGAQQKPIYQVSFAVPYGTKFSRGLKIIAQ